AFNNNSKTLIARVNLENNSHLLKVGSLVNARITGDSLQALWVPASAVVDLGENKIVWLSDGDHFKAKKVETGIHSDNMIQITGGLTETDKIADEGHFLSDSEDFIKISGDE
ncbi:MAG TPA: efflux RND transporter periplasmic adaptor subunit, partial [Bacteroidia bacterium]|nr:efflux RND transporter periplasmic adaptor subunit [Bacteroidia bacterium]